MNNQNHLWMDGQYYPVSDAKIPALSQTFHYGFGVYEGIRSYKTDHGAAIFRLQDHIDRLFQSAHILGIKIPYTKNDLAIVLCDLLKKNHLTNAYLRPVVFMGDEYLGLHTQQSSVHVMIAAIAWNHFFITQEQLKKGISLKTATHERVALKNGLNQAKANGLYLISILANNEARAAGYDDALMLDPHGFVAEGSGANVMMIKNHCLYTPFCHFALDGITRKTIINMAKEYGLSVTEKNMTLDELYQADEVFFTGTAAEVLAVTTIDHQKIASGERGKITAQLQKAYTAITTAQMPQNQEWLTFIDEKIPQES